MVKLGYNQIKEVPPEQKELLKSKRRTLAEELNKRIEDLRNIGIY